MEIHITVEGPDKRGYFQAQVSVDDRIIANIHDCATDQKAWQVANQEVAGLIHENQVNRDIEEHDKFLDAK